MNNRYFILGQIALLCWREGHAYGGSNHMMAVGFVLRNRVKAGMWDGDWLQNIRNWYAQSAVHLTDITWDDIPTDIWNRDFQNILRFVEDLYDGVAEDTMTVSPGGSAGGFGAANPPRAALYYADLSHVTREWFKDKILGNREAHPRVAEIIPLYFFA